MSPRPAPVRLAFLITLILAAGSPLPTTAARDRIAPKENWRAMRLVRMLQDTYQVSIAGFGETGGGAWREMAELQWTAEAVRRVAAAVGGPAHFRRLLGGVVRVARWPVGVRAFAPPGRLAAVGDVVLTDYHFEHGRLYALYLTAHEFGHVLDTRSGGRLSRELARSLGARRCPSHVPPDECPFDLGAAAEPAPGHPDEPYARRSPEEYWAEVFATYSVPEYYAADAHNHSLGPRARRFVEAQLVSRP